MHFVLKSILVGAVMCSAAFSFSQVRAEVFVIEDQQNSFSLSFPDSWATTTNQKPDDKLTIAGPGVNDYAVCRVRVRQDKRYAIYPVAFSDPVQKVAYSREFWTDYLGEYEDIIVDAFKDESGVGKAFASTAEASFMSTDGTPVRKRGIMFAGLYFDRAYIVDCSSEQTLYDKWRPQFLSIIKSVDFSKMIHEFPNGDYRKFQEDPEVKIQGPAVLDVYKF